MLVGYDDRSKAYRLYDPIKRRIIVSHEVDFLEQQLGDFGTHSSHPCDVFSSLFDSEGELLQFQQREGEHLLHHPGQAAAAPVPAAAGHAAAAPLPAAAAPFPAYNHLDPEAEQHIAPQAADINAPHDHQAIDAPIRVADPEPPCRYPQRERRPTERSKLYYRTDHLALTVASDEPLCDKITVKQALAHKGWQALAHKGWRAAMQKEYDSLIGTGTWTVGPLPQVNTLYHLTGSLRLNLNKMLLISG